jgi:hypothetical protein
MSRKCFPVPLVRNLRTLVEGLTRSTFQIASAILPSLGGDVSFGGYHTVHTEDAYWRAAEASGADAFLLKKTLMAALLPTIRRVRSSMSPPNPP